ncbi:hypothetical protein CNMCM5793_009293 [Aspergillus hiratsukae]|uniref:Uncharacterized protein n=1 Tax=Aspergillus hiratsukae TaxID=1194566 RepID=A0A8H6P8A0_9EURO|nr:hypothetical protein CNMCM5793_009293 [Aspergillus hiratsukae]KAF7169123.1 hypothetical protein CNMCM6106_004062 [Aspergillus hiratsukae]
MESKGGRLSFSTIQYPQDSSAQASQRLELEAAIAETQFHDERVEDTEYYTNFLEQIMGLVRNGDQAAVSRMISVIRSGASQEDILKAISEISNNSRDGQEGNRGNS